MKSKGIPLYLHCRLEAKIHAKALMNEGIDLTYSKDGVKVSYNPKHQQGINARLEDNPTSVDLLVPKIEVQQEIVRVYSILQRTPMKVAVGSSDGNPLVYAFKNENNYSFKSEYDKKTIQDCIDMIIKKFVEKYFSSIEGNVATIVCPSENTLNNVFAYAFRKNAESLGKFINLYDDILVKYPVEDFRYEVIDNPKSDLNQWILSLPADTAMKKRAILDKALDKMDASHNGVFAYHFIKDPDIRKHISSTMKTPSNAKDINDENIIVLDDTVSQGKTLVEACSLLYGSYLPKTVTALTLFSPLKS